MAHQTVEALRRTDETANRSDIPGMMGVEVRFHNHVDAEAWARAWGS